MKICDKCGAYNSDERIFCIDCNEKLNDSLSSLDERKIQEDLNEKIENMYNKQDPLYVSRFDKIIGYISLAGVLLSLILIIIFKITERTFDYVWIGLIFLFSAIITAFFSKVLWAIEKIRLSFLINDSDNAEPSSFYRTGRKAALLISATVGIVILFINVLDFRYPPIRKYISDIAATKSILISSNTKDYINANPEKWEKIICTGDYAVEIFFNELNEAKTIGLEKELIIEAITEIKEKQDDVHNNNEYLFPYNTYGWNTED